MFCFEKDNQKSWQRVELVTLNIPVHHLKLIQFAGILSTVLVRKAKTAATSMIDLEQFLLTTFVDITSMASVHMDNTADTTT